MAKHNIRVNELNSDIDKITAKRKLQYAQVWGFDPLDLVTKQYVDSAIGGLNGFIQNQNLAPQGADFWIDGDGKADSFSIGTHIITEDKLAVSSASWATGVTSFLGISVVSGTQFSVGAAVGYIIDNTDVVNQQVIPINYAGAINLVTPYLGTNPATYLSLDTSGALIMSPTEPDEIWYRTHILLGAVAHPNGAITGVSNKPDVMFDFSDQMRDMFRPIRFINDGVIVTNNAANLALANTGGKLYGLGIGLVTNGKNKPSTRDIAAGAPTTFQYRTRTGVATADTTLVIPASYDVGGVVTPVGGGAGASTNQRFYLLENGVIRAQYGQTVYATLTEAIAASSSELFTVFPNFKSFGILIGILSINKSCTNLSDTATARFLSVSKFGETVGGASGIATGSLQSAYNNSINPEITTNLVNAAVAIRRGTLLDSDQVFDIQNGAGTTTAFIQGDGKINASGYLQTFSFNASAGLARPNLISPTLVATANNDVLVGLDIAPTFTNGAFTNISQAGVRIIYNSSVFGDVAAVNIRNTSSLLHSNYRAQDDLGTRFGEFGVLASATTSGASFGLAGEVFIRASTGATGIHISSVSGPIRLSTNSGSEKFRLFATGNITIQSGGTFTDNGFRLEVVGTARVTGQLTVGNGTTGAITAISGAAGNNRSILFQTGSLFRWVIRGANSTAESGSNAGSDFEIIPANDAGAIVGNTAFFINRASGNVGINTTTPASKLDVNGLITSRGATGEGLRIADENAFISFYNAANSVRTGYIQGAVAGGRLVIEAEVGTKYILLNPVSGGNVGIGTITPTDKLDVFGAIVVGDTAERFSIVGSAIGFNRNTGTGAIYDSNKYAYQFNHNGSLTAASDFLALQVYDPAGVGVSPNALVVNGVGNVGIGTTAPTSYGAGYTSVSIFNATNSGILDIYSQGTRRGFLYGTSGPTFNMASALGSDLALETNNTERVRVLSSNGNVGIGTTTPAEKLHVVGSTLFNAPINHRFQINSLVAFEIWDNAGTANILHYVPVINGTYNAFQAIALPAATGSQGKIWAQNIAGTIEMRVMDSVGNATTISPHNSCMIPKEEIIDEMSWFYYSERGEKRINVNLYRAIKALEKLTGEKYIYQDENATPVVEEEAPKKSKKK